MLQHTAYKLCWRFVAQRLAAVRLACSPGVDFAETWLMISSTCKHPATAGLLPVAETLASFRAVCTFSSQYFATTSTSICTDGSSLNQRYSYKAAGLWQQHLWLTARCNAPMTPQLQALIGIMHR